MNDYLYGDVQCPFFRDLDRKHHQIVCEGLTDSSTICLRHQRKKDFMLQVQFFCCGKYRNCEINHAITEAKYQDESE